MTSSEPNHRNLYWDSDLWVGGTVDPTTNSLSPDKAIRLNALRQSIHAQLSPKDNLDVVTKNPQLFFTACMIYNSAIEANEFIQKMKSEEYEP